MAGKEPKIRPHIQFGPDFALAEGTTGFRDLGDAIKGFKKSMGNEDGDKPAVDEPKGQTIDAQARKVEEPAKKD